MTDEHLPDDVFERLHGDARANPIPEHVMDVQTKEGLAEARTLVNLAIHEKRTTGAELSRRTAIKESAISDFRRNKWGKRKKGLEATVASKLAKAINLIIREQEAKTTEIGGFVSIRLSEAIFAIVQYAVKRRQIAAFFVPAGCGKTVALKALEIDTPGAILVTVTRSRRTVKSFFQLLARQLNLNETGRAEDIQDRIVDCLRDTNRLILIDEAHKLSVAAIDGMREIWDQAKIPIVLAGTPSLRQTLTAQRVGTHYSEIMDQLYSRVGICRDLTELENPQTGQPERRFTVADIRKIYAKGHVRIAVDGVQFLCKLANTPGAGGLRTCSALVQIVVDLWSGEIVTTVLLHEALKIRLGVRGAGDWIEPEPVGIEPAAVKTG